mmetsp:Transcript_11997/g.28111  ORF Transcript_11997/g.28111 Transcript_11997/m.28111 type:complete len:254 (-) Transcript_11997:135-896(-)
MVAAGRGSEIVGLQYGLTPLSAQRCASLYGVGGPDDLFSSDFSDPELARLLGHMSTSGQVALDESSPPTFSPASASANPSSGIGDVSGGWGSGNHIVVGDASAGGNGGLQQGPRGPSGGGGRRASGLRLFTLVACSLGDEYVPQNVNNSELADRLVKAMASAAAGATPRADAAPPTSKGAPAEGAAGIAADVSAPPTEAGDSGSLEGGVSEVSALKLADANHNLSSPPSAAACFVGAVGELLFRAAGPGAPAR